MIYTIGGIKGGTGKSTLAANLAVMLKKSGRDVLLVDADDQPTATLFTAKRNETLGASGYTAIRLREMDVYHQVMNMKERFDDVVIDTGGRDTKSQRSALAVTDLYILPFRPRSFDVWTIYDVVQVIEEIRMLRPALQAVAVLNQIDSTGTEVEDTRKLFLEDEAISRALTFLDTPIGSRKVFAHAASEGLAVIEYKNRDRKAIEEIQRFFDAVVGIKPK